MRRLILPLTFAAIATACTPTETLQGDTLEARLAGQVLRFESETDETIVITLRRDGTGEVRDILPSDRPDRVDDISWTVQGEEICLTGQSGRVECEFIAFAGNRVTVGTGDDPLTGTITPL